MYRESEAQTNPYSPEYVLAPGARPEVLLLQSLKANNGLPINNREIDMIGQARVKKELELNALPMTDETCFVTRKKMMETQELRELAIREADIDAKFEQRLTALKVALDEKNDTNEFLASQRVESVRQARMEDREKVMQGIRKNRIQVLRRLARKRNEAEPLLSGTAGRDIINEYYDRGSTVYAPLKREGATVISSRTTADVSSRTLPLNSLDVIAAVEDCVPTRLKGFSNDLFNPEKKYLSSTLPVGVSKGGGRAAVPRLTSAATRTLRNTKSDVDTMYEIIQSKKKKTALKPHSPTTPQSRSASSNNVHRMGASQANVLTLDARLHADKPQTDAASKPATPKKPSTSPSRKSTASSMLAGKPKGRPDTPDIASQTAAESTGESLKAAVTMLQKLLRGRAVQNSMYEGRHRQKEVIEEMRASDEATMNVQSEEQQMLELNRLKEYRWRRVQRAVEDKIVGALASNLLFFLEKEKERNDTIDDLVSEASKATFERARREAAEAGRRQREMVPLSVPGGLNGNAKPSAGGGGNNAAEDAVEAVSNNQEEDPIASTENEPAADTAPSEAPSGNQAEEDAAGSANNNQEEEVPHVIVSPSSSILIFSVFVPKPPSSNQEEAVAAPASADTAEEPSLVQEAPVTDEAPTEAPAGNQAEEEAAVVSVDHNQEEEVLPSC